MIFVNKIRVRYNPQELHHGDHILFGTRHIFQYINPMESASLGIGVDDDDNKSNDNNQNIQKILDKETETHKHVNSIFDMKNIMTQRLQTNEFRIGNVEFSLYFKSN